MKSSALVFFLYTIAVVSGQQDSEDNDNGNTNDSEEKNTKPKVSSSSAKSVSANQREKPDFLVTPDDKLTFNLRHQSFHPESSTIGAIPPLGFSLPESQRQNFFLSDGTGRYSVQLQRFQQQNPSHFNTAVGAISAHILNQRTNQEYIPYPPNGDPYNYPDYRGYPQATEPPVVRAYETTSNANYGTQPSANINRFSSRRLFPNNGYHLPFPNQFDNFGLGFYNNPYFLDDGGFYQGLRRSDDLNRPEDRFYEQRNYRRPIKRYT